MKLTDKEKLQLFIAKNAAQSLDDLQDKLNYLFKVAGLKTKKEIKEKIYETLKELVDILNEACAPILARTKEHCEICEKELEETAEKIVSWMKELAKEEDDKETKS